MTKDLDKLNKQSPEYKQGFLDGGDWMKKMTVRYLRECKEHGYDLANAIEKVRDNL